MENSEQDMIGLSELIEKVKSELLSTSTQSAQSIPIFSVDQVVLELQVITKREGKAGLKIYVAEVGGTASHQDYQKVTVTLSPLLSKEERIQHYKEKYPEHWDKLIENNTKSTLKGSSQESLSDLYDS